MFSCLEFRATQNIKFMRKLPLKLLFFMLLLAASCSEESDLSESAMPSGEIPGNGQQGQSGLITAGEWNDLERWDYWKDLFGKQDYAGMPSYWSFFTNGRVAVQVVDNNGVPMWNAKVELKNNNQVIWSARTDNFGKAELWIGLYQQMQSVSTDGYTLTINGGQEHTRLKLFEEGVNQFIIPNPDPTAPQKAEIAFIVDATGSMGDELEFLKKDLEDVIRRVKENHPNTAILTSSVFYRDEGDAYVTRVSHFTDHTATTLNFIRQQSADGGGDFPEAVHTALNKTINELQWSDGSKTRIAFLLLDAPPHYEQNIINELQRSVAEAAKKGIKIIPITASGIEKETEFLMRFFALSTNGTYVFITNHSGIGNDHLEPSVGEYEVEYLNNLMVRLINKYMQ
ncbi:von Willebrand factor type A-like protein [Flammeovirgaceae bacterium 311]|nr:von Willebrand factor type A-like protein [Flammeovirgaceae bacterium 311]